MRLALVHHANQFLVTDGYDNREGISEAVDRYLAALDLHSRYRVPANLHLSGTLVEAAAWHRPDLLERIRELGPLITPVGGTYAENVMTLFDEDVNRRQIREALELYDRHLDWAPKVFWVPERVWNTEQLAGVIAEAGYESVLLDDRVFFPQGPERDRFDAGPRPPVSPCRIKGGHGLVAIPISFDLRYWIPPRSEEDYGRLESLSGFVVYADDLEKTAGVGGYWDPSGLDRYEAFLERLSADVVGLEGLTGPEREVGPGTFYELAVGWGAGEDYRGWADSPAWVPYRAHLDDALEAVRRTGSELGWKHYLASCYETAWHDPVDWPKPEREPAPWARAIASHARACLVIAGETAPDEVELRDGELRAVISPAHGGRLVWLFSGERLMIGNPTDHWNWQEEPDRYMDVPPNHPGALVDVGHEHEPWTVSEQNRTSVVLTSALGRKRVRLRAGVVEVCYRLADPEELIVETCLSPDYLELLRGGRAAFDATAIQVVPGAGARFAEPIHRDPGHGVLRAIEGGGHFHFDIRSGIR